MFSHGGCMAVKRAIDAGDVRNVCHPLYDGVRKVVEYVEANEACCCGSSKCACEEVVMKEVG